MLAIARHQEIIKRLEGTGSIRTVELAQHLRVTDETIRRDLEKLEREGVLRRTHGGAVAVEHHPHEQAFSERSVQHIQAKREIAQMAAALVAPGNRIYIDASSTALQLVPFITREQLTIMTNSLKVIESLNQQAQHHLILTGGDFDPLSQSFLGPDAIATVRRYRFHLAFCSGNGIDLHRGISEINRHQANLKETVIDQSDRFVYLADSSKLGLSSDHFFGPCNRIDTLVTDHEADHPALDALEDIGVNILRPTAEKALANPV